jgi:hypothetical protein
MSSRVFSESGVRIAITVGVGLIGAAVGFRHTHDWAVENGQTGIVAWAVAVVVECMAIVSAMELRRRYGLVPLAVLVGSFVLQMAAQVSSARPTFAGWLLAATPALGFLIIVKFALRAAADASVAGQQAVQSGVTPVAESTEDVRLPFRSSTEDFVVPEQREIEQSAGAFEPEPVPAMAAVSAWPPKG